MIQDGLCKRLDAERLNQLSAPCRHVFFSRMTVAMSRPVSGSRILAQNAYTLRQQHNN